MSVFLSIFYSAIIGLFHPFYISMTDINYNDKNAELEISVRLFSDDLENTLYKYHPNQKIDIEHPANIAQINGFVNEYIQKNLSVALNGKPTVMSFVGYEKEAESIWTYFEIKGITSVQKIEIKNTLLHDYNENQVNLIHIKNGSKEVDTKLDYPNSKASFTF